MRFTTIAVLLLASSFTHADPGGQGRGIGQGRGGGKLEGRGNGGTRSGGSGIPSEEKMIAELEYDAAEKTEEAIEGLDTLKNEERGELRGTKPEGFRVNGRGSGSDSGSGGGRSHGDRGPSLSFEDPDANGLLKPKSPTPPVEGDFNFEKKMAKYLSKVDAYNAAMEKYDEYSGILANGGTLPTTADARGGYRSEYRGDKPSGRYWSSSDENSVPGTGDEPAAADGADDAGAGDVPVIPLPATSAP